MDEILNAVSTVGFPIACTIALFWQLSNEQKAHKEEMTALRDVIVQNTVAITELREQIKDKL